jgi:signal transduction histidine kinase
VTRDLEPATVLGDAALLERMVANLLDNAVRHNRPAGHVALRTRRESAEAVLEVANSGLGIREEDLPRLFEPFVRSTPAASRSAGTGLGLAIVRAVASAHGGRVDAQPSGDGGLSVLVRLPAGALRNPAGAVTRTARRSTGTVEAVIHPAGGPGGRTAARGSRRWVSWARRCRGRPSRGRA